MHRGYADTVIVNLSWIGVYVFTNMCSTFLYAHVYLLYTYVYDLIVTSNKVYGIYRNIYFHLGLRYIIFPNSA